MNQPVIVCGLGRVGWPVLEYLKAAGLPVAAIDLHARPEDPRLTGVRFIQGDCRRQELFEQIGLANARGVLILTSDDLVNISTALMIRHLHPEVRIVVRLFNQNLIARLGQAVHNVYAMSVSALTAPVLALTALSGEALGSFHLDDGPRLLAEVDVARAGLAGQSISQVTSQHELAVLAHWPAAGKEHLLADIDAKAALVSGDRLIVCGKPGKLQALTEVGEADWLPQLRLAGLVRRQARMIQQAVTEIDTPVKVCTLVLLAVVLASTLVYCFGMGRAFHDGLFRTISVAAGGDLHEEELAEPWQKVFVAFLRIMGAAVVATFTALVTNYLIRARLGTALEIRRIPDGGHVVVCGLGNIGFRVVEELLQRGERVVVIESSAQSRFIATTRRQGVAVILGDATVSEVLRQANAGTARAVIAATDNQLSNLEIALLVRELNPKQRVVLRMSDPHLAQVLREAANVRYAMSTSSLAAPAFVAALFGDRVLNLFLIGGKALAIVELTVEADEPVCNQSVRALSLDYRMVPVSLTRARTSTDSIMLGHRLAVGDKLVAILTLPDLARLLRRERVPTDWAVQVTEFPIPARGWLIQLLRTQRQLDAGTAEKAVDALPLELACDVTRGQAEDLVALCSREKVTTKLQQVDGKP